MNPRITKITQQLINQLIHHNRTRPISTHQPTGLVDPETLNRVCTILYQQQHSPFTRLQTHLQKTQFNLTHEFFLQICNKFPLSWRPTYLFYRFTLTRPGFEHTHVTLNKLLDVIAKSRNIDLLWGVLDEMGRGKMVNLKSYVIGLVALCKARELKKCVELFHMMNKYGYDYDLDVLNTVIMILCREKLVYEAKHVVWKLRDVIRMDQVTYKLLVCGFCDVGDVVEACSVWNLMVDEGFEVDVDVGNKMMERFFKDNRFDEGLKLFRSMCVERIDEVGLKTYRILIEWMCRKGKISEACLVFDEMKKRGIEADNATVGAIVYGLLVKSRIREAYLMVESVERPDICVYHALIRGLIKVRKVGEATEVFREMIRRGCEPIMHTYIMLLQGHLGKRGRKGNDPLVNFDSIFVGGLVKSGKFLEATKYTERSMKRGLEVPRFDYNKFLHYFSNEEGAVMFNEVGKKLREVGSFDLADIFIRFGEKMATRDRRRSRNTPENPDMASEDCHMTSSNHLKLGD